MTTSARAAAFGISCVVAAACSPPLDVDAGVSDGGQAIRDGAAAVDDDNDAGAATTRRSDGGVSDAGLAEAGDAHSPLGPTKCDSLADCCDALGAGHKLHSTCVGEVDTQNKAACAAELNALHAGGYCTGGTQCAVLATCCPKVPSSNTDYCQGFVDDKSDIQCDRALSTFRHEGWCP